MASTAVGPLLLSVGHDATGSHQPVLLALAILPAVIALDAPFARRPHGTAEPATPEPGGPEPVAPAEPALRR